MAPVTISNTLKLALPKGHLHKGVCTLMNDAGIAIRSGSRDYRPIVSLPDVDTKYLRPQNIVEMLHIGSRDVGFAGADWVAELQADVVELLDTGMDPVQIVAAAPEEDAETLFERPLIVASEYKRLTTNWIKKRNLEARFVRSYGATEVFPPEDADCIVDNTATGSTLRANGLAIVDEIMRSSTRLYANRKAMENPVKRPVIERMTLLLRSALESRRRVMVEVNVDNSCLEEVISVLPCMRKPTISRLHGMDGYAVKAAVPKDELSAVIPAIKAKGGTDIVVSTLAHIVP